jgi:general secretion pathway protein M
MRQLTPIQSKAAALTILLAVVVLVVASIVVPLWLLHLRYDMAVDDASTRFGRYSRVIGMRDGLQKKAVELKVLEINRHFLKGASPPLAAAELQERAKTIIEASGGKLSSVQILPHKDDDVYRKVTVSLQLTATYSAVKAMLYALESAPPYLFVDNFVVRLTNNLAVRSEAAIEPDLMVQFDLTGYALKGAQ